MCIDSVPALDGYHLVTLFIHIFIYKALIYLHIDGLVQECSNSIANAMELLQSCIKPLIYCDGYPVQVHTYMVLSSLIWSLSAA